MPTANHTLLKLEYVVNYSEMQDCRITHTILRTIMGTGMKTDYKIIALSVIIGMFVWVIDALLDCLLFYEGTFLELLILDIPKHDIYVRSVILASFTIFGIIVAGIMGKRKTADEALRQSEEKFRTLVDTTSDWVWEVDLNGPRSAIGFV